MIKLQGISKSFDGQLNILDNVSFSVNEKEFLAVVGSSGSGKTTLIKLITRLIYADKGTISYKETDIRLFKPILLRRLFGHVFQQPSLFPHLTVSQNICFPLRIREISPKEQIKRCEELLSFVRLDSKRYASRFPHELSGGEQQRVNLARALAHDPEVLLMDEPFSALDALTRQELQQDLLKLQQQLHKTILFITHDLSEAMLLANRIAVLHQGHLQQIDEKNKIVQQPKTAFVKELIVKGLQCV